MNRDSRNLVMRKTRDFLSAFDELYNDYISFIEDLKQDEEQKLGNLPQPLSESIKGEQISDALARLDDALNALDELKSQADSLPDTLDVEMKRSRKKTDNKLPAICKNAALSNPGENRTKRLQLLITPTLDSAIRSQSSNLNLSANDLINRILIQNLCK